MRKSIFGAVVVVLAGACWVLAQNASTNRWSSPYGTQMAPFTSPGPVLAPVAVQRTVPQALTPVERAERLVSAPQSEPTLAPTTELDFPSIPTVPAFPGLPPVPNSFRPIPADPASVPSAIAQPETPTIPAMPQPLEPPTSNGFQQPMPISPLPQLPQPTFKEIEPPNLKNPNIYAPQPMIVEEKPTLRTNIAPGIPGLPPLPPVPGFTNAPPGIPNYMAPAVSGIGQPVFVPSPPENLKGNGPAPLQTPPAVWTDNDPAYWNGRQPLLVNEPSRSIGPRMWGSVDYLLWLAKTANAPPLVQGVQGVQTGQSSFNGAQIVDLYPAGKIDYGSLNGVRGTFGFWLNGSQTLGIETNYMWFGPASSNASFASGPGTILGRPFYNATVGGNSIFQVSSLNGTNGAVSVQNSIHVEGGDANVLLNSMSVGPRLNLIAGFHYLNISENLRVNDTSSNPGTGFAARSFDSFGTLNQFFGGQVGLRWAYQGDRLFTSFTGKIAYGAMLEHVRIDGGTSLSAPGVNTSASGGVLALPTNIGSYNRTQATFLPEAIANVGYRIFPWATIAVGYNFTYVHDLVRPGSQIDTAVNPQNFPFGGGSASASHPGFQFHREDLWLQGINFSMMFNY